MATGNTKAIGVHMTEGEHAALLALAGRLGCTSTRGATKGDPSLRALFSAIAAGELVVKRQPHRPKASRVAAADRVRAEIERDPDATMAEIAARAECSISLVSKVKAGER